MKKIFTLVAAALVAMGANAQEKWDVTAVTDMATAEQTFNNATTNVSLKIASYLNEKNIQDGTTAWSTSGGADSNMALNTADCVPAFNNAYLKGMGNPYVVDAGGHWEETDNGQAWRDDPNAQVFTADCGKLPVHGTYYTFTTKAAGSLKLAVYVNKGNHETFVVDADTKTPLPASSIAVAFYYQNNTFTFDDKGNTISIVKGNMPDDNIIQHTNGYTQNRPAMGYMTFDVAANKTYYVFNPKSQLGLYGFEFTAGTTGINEITTNTVNENAPVYNLAGQRVSKDTKGILIQNGKKFINK